MIRILKDNALFFSMALGIILGVFEGLGWFRLIIPGWLLPVLIFLMLFFTFCKIDPLELRLYRWHWILLVFQVVVSAVLFYAIRPFSLLLAQGVMMCVFMPSATAAPIIAGKLGGSIRTLTSYTLLSSVATAFLVPSLFPLYNPSIHVSFYEQFIAILRHISPLLLGPFFAAWALRLIYNVVMRAEHSPKKFELKGILASLPFWIWVFTLIILMHQTVLSLFSYEGTWSHVVWLFVGALLTCMLQFWVGKHVGERWPSGDVYRTRISAGQALGQKNTTLAIWMAQTYMNPVSSLAPAAYILWQNLFNNWQIARAANGYKV